MRYVTSRQLKAKTNAILRRVRERGESIEITRRGRVVARLVPAEPAPRGGGDLSELWADIDRLAKEIGASWPAGVNAVEAVREGRREL